MAGRELTCLRRMETARSLKVRSRQSERDNLRPAIDTRKS